MNDTSQTTLLAVLLQLEQRARACSDEQDLAFLMVNDTHALAPYRQAVLWRAEPGGDGVIAALSGLAVPERNAPFNVWLSGLLTRRLQRGEGRAAGPLRPDPDELAMWIEHLPAHAWLLPLPLHRQATDTHPTALLLLLRAAPWQPR